MNGTEQRSEIASSERPQKITFTLIPERFDITMEFPEPELVSLAGIQSYLAAYNGVPPPYTFVSRGQVIRPEEGRSIADLNIQGSEGVVFYTRGGSRRRDDTRSANDSVMDSESLLSLFDNREFINSIMGRTPQIQALRESCPELDSFLEDPQVMRQLFQAMRNPGMAREMIRTSDRALSRVDVIPGGMDALRQIYQEVQEPIWESMQRMASDGEGAREHIETPSNIRDPEEEPFPHLANAGGAPSPIAAPLATPTLGGSPFSRLGSLTHNVRLPPGDAAAVGVHINVRRPSEINERLFQGGGAGDGNDEGVPPFRRPYARQLEVLKEMGYTDEERNIEALRRNGGNLNRALDDLMGL